MGCIPDGEWSPVAGTWLGRPGCRTYSHDTKIRTHLRRAFPAAAAIRMTRSFSNGPPVIPAAPTTTAARHMNCCGFNSPMATTMAVRSASTRFPRPVTPTSVCSTSQSRTEAVGATRTTIRKTWPRPSGSYFESPPLARIVPMESTGSPPTTRSPVTETLPPWARSTPTVCATRSGSLGTG